MAAAQGKSSYRDEPTGQTGVIQDADRPGATVNLLDKDFNVLETTTADATGFYEFTGLAPGDCTVEFEMPAGDGLTYADQGGNTNDRPLAGNEQTEQ